MAPDRPLTECSRDAAARPHSSVHERGAGRAAAAQSEAKMGTEDLESL